jgi:lysophospholipase L1-like esterase
MDEALNVKWSIDLSNPSTINSAEDFVLGFPYVLAPPPANTPRSQIETAVGLQPTFVSFWLGSNDALGAALAATVTDDTLTPVATFNADADAAAGAIAGTGAKAVVLNVPDVTVIPNLFSEKDLEALTGLTAAQIKLLFGVAKTSYVPLSALPTLQAIAGGTAQGPLAPNQILTKKEIKKIRKNIKAYNNKLKAIADANGWAFVDINATLTDYDKNGVVIPTVGTLTTAYLGGLFGLDGVHPSSTGHALIATAIVQAINAKYGTSLVGPDVVAIASADPQVCMAGSAKSATLADIAKYAPAARAAESVILHHGAAH